MGDVLIPSLKIGDCTDRICVRVSRFWEFFDPQNETKLLHADLVLIDEEGNSIHAQIYPPAFDQFRSLIKEGRVYNLSCFRVKKANRKYKPVANDAMISLSKWTTVEEVVDVPPAFPMFTYALTPIEQVPSRNDYAEYFTDVIGIVSTISAVTTLRTRIRQDDTSKRTVTIQGASNASMDVVLWGERATSFPAEQLHKDGQASAQIIIFVGTLIKNYAGIVSLSGSSGCRWYINPEVPEAKALTDSVRHKQQPVRWDQHIVPVGPTLTAEPKKISDIKFLNPFKNKKTEFLVTVTVKKIDSSWWYNACRKCFRTAKPHGNTYKCSDTECHTAGEPTQRYKLSIIAGDETGDVDFIIFGRWVQRLTKKTVDTLITENPPGFIPNEITKLLEKTFVWNVSFTQNTIGSGRVCFQVNAVVNEIDDGSTLLVKPPGSQSSLIVSQDDGSSIQSRVQRAAVLSSSSGQSQASGSTPAKAPMDISEPPITPQSTRCMVESEATRGMIAPTAENSPKPTDTPSVLTRSPAATRDIDVDMPGSTSPKTQKSSTRKRPRPSPTRRVSKKLDFTDDSATGEDTPLLHAVTGSSSSKDE